MVSLPYQQNAPEPPSVSGPGPMVVCGDDTLAHRLATELRDVYRERVTLVVPPGSERPLTRAPLGGRSRAGVLLNRMSAAVGRAAGGMTGDGAGPMATPPPEPLRVQESPDPDVRALTEAGVEEAAALALVYDDDETNIRAALTARRLNPQLRLVIRLYNRKLGSHLQGLLDQAAALGGRGPGAGEPDVSTTVLSDADTAAPALAATAVAGTSKVVQADGLLLRAAERTPSGAPPGRTGGVRGAQGRRQAQAQGRAPDSGRVLRTLALLSSTSHDPGGTEGSDTSGTEAPQLLPDEREVAQAEGRGTVVLETVSYAGSENSGWQRGRGAPLGELFSRRLRWAVAGMFTVVLGLAVTQWELVGGNPLHSGYLTLLDLFGIGDPAVGEPADRQIIQLLSGIAGIVLLPLLIAASLEALGTFRTASSLRRPPRGLGGHVVLLGLGKVGTRVLSRLRELEIPVVCVEADPEARGIPLARRLRVPTVLGDVTEEGVLESAKIHRASALLALTSSDTTNLEAALYARTLSSRLRVSLRLYDDDFATAVFRTLRAAHPGALTRSRSVTSLAAPAFAGAMMGREVLGAIPVERRVLLFAALEVGDHPNLVGRSVDAAFRPGVWRILALDAAPPAEEHADPYGPDGTAAEGRFTKRELDWNVPGGHVLQPDDRVLVAATRQGLAELLGRR